MLSSSHRLDCFAVGKLFKTSDPVEDESDSEMETTVPKKRSARAKRASDKSGRKKKGSRTGGKNSEAATDAVPTTLDGQQVSPTPAPVFDNN